MNLPDEFVARVTAWAEGRPSVQELWLFGSRARGDHHAGSDADLAIWMPGDRGQVLGIFVARADAWQDELEALAEMPISLQILGINDELDEIVHREGVMLWSRETTKAPPADAGRA